MAEYRRPLHRRIGLILSRMDAAFLQDAECYFGGGTQLAMAYGEYRESRDIDFLVSSHAGYRAIFETVNERSLGALFKGKVTLEREVRIDRYGIRALIKEEENAAPIKLEVVLEGRILLAGGMDRALGVPILDAPHAIAEKLLANTERGRAREHHSRDLIDLAFVSRQTDARTFIAGYQIAEAIYGAAVARELGETLKMVSFDADYRARCVENLLLTDAKELRKNLDRLGRLKRLLRHSGPQSLARKTSRR